jgi:hypothetical protein
MDGNRKRCGLIAARLMRGQELDRNSALRPTDRMTDGHVDIKALRHIPHCCIAKVSGRCLERQPYCCSGRFGTVLEPSARLLVPSAMPQSGASVEAPRSSPQPTVWQMPLAPRLRENWARYQEHDEPIGASRAGFPKLSNPPVMRSRRYPSTIGRPSGGSQEGVGSEQKGVFPRRPSRTSTPVRTAAGRPPLASARLERDQLRLDGSIELLVPSQIDGCRLSSWRR